MSNYIHYTKKLGLLFYITCIVFVLNINIVNAQTTAGNAIYNFLSLPHSAKITSLGGVNISSMGNDIGMAMYNPSLLLPTMEKTLTLSVKPYFAGIQQYDLMNVNYWEKKKITWSAGVHYLNYGNINMTDLAGNDIGTMHPADYAVQFSAASDYIKHFSIGASIKFIHSNYGLYKSNGLAMDIGLKYLSENQLNQGSILVNNMGMQFDNGHSQQELPFNIIIGLSRKLENAPIQFSLTADRMSVWKNVYYDPVFALAQGETAPNNLQNLINHLTVAAELYIGQQIDFDLGYNFIRRYDLNLQNQSNGLNGFATGFGIKLERMDFQYGTSFFQQNSYHHFSVSYKIKK
jgi:hypothetical protein